MTIAKVGTRILNRIIVHHSASPRTATRGDIERWHKANGWSEIGYHYIVEDDGAVIVGRQLTHQGAHCNADGANKDSIGICVTGNNTRAEDKWSEIQIEALVGLLRELYSRYGRLTIYGHRDVPGAATLCPGLSIRELLEGHSLNG